MNLFAKGINTLTGDCANNVQKARKLYEFEIIEVFIDLHDYALNSGKYKK